MQVEVTLRVIFPNGELVYGATRLDQVALRPHSRATAEACLSALEDLVEQARESIQKQVAADSASGMGGDDPGLGPSAGS